MKEYLNKFINADCMDYLTKCPTNYFQLAIVDPPYGIGDKFKGGKTGKMNFKMEKRNDFF